MNTVGQVTFKAETMESTLGGTKSACGACLLTSEPSATFEDAHFIPQS